MRVAICDDETEVINKLTGYINRFASEYGNIKIKKFNSAEDVVEYYKTNGNVFDMKIRSFLDAIKTGGTAPIPSSQILYNQANIDGIAKSAAIGHEVEIEIPEI